MSIHTNMATLPTHALPSPPLNRQPPGYPRYTSLMSAHPSFQNFRRFSQVRMRLLLLQQDEISRLEAELQRIDASENCVLFLGSSRRDANVARKQVLAQLKDGLKDYDAMLSDYHQALSFPAASSRDIESLKNWVEGTSSISRVESAYLEEQEDLLNLTGMVDNAMTRIEGLVEDVIMFFSSCCRKYASYVGRSQGGGSTSDDNIFIPGPNVSRLSRGIMTWLTTLILLVPVIILYCLSNGSSKLFTIVLASGAFLLTLSIFTKARTFELFTAGAAYAAVLVVFTSAGNSIRSIKE